jgi:hypothetical protein
VRTSSGVIRTALAACVVAWLCAPARAAEPITITIAVEDSEIITADQKRIRLAEPAEIRFAVTNNYLEQLYGTDLTTPRRGLRLEVLAGARATLASVTGVEATGDNGVRLVIEAINRRIDDLGVRVERHTLRYVFVSGIQP